MKEEYYAIEIKQKDNVLYLKNIYSYTFTGKLKLYLTYKKNVIDAKRYKTLRNAQKNVDKITSWFESEGKGEGISIKPLKVEVEINIKTVQL